MHEISYENKDHYKIIGEEIPDDKYKANSEFEEFEYYIVDENGINLFPERAFKAISREIDGEFCWLYYNEFSKYNSLVTLFTDFTMMPFWGQERLQVDITGYEREKYNDTLNISYEITNNNKVAAPVSQTGTSEDLLNDVKLIGTSTLQDVSLLVNGELNNEFDLHLSPGEIYDGDITLQGDYVYSDLSIEFLFEDYKYKVIDENNYYPEIMKKEIILNTGIDDKYEISFNDEIENITNIISDGFEIKEENITFYKKFYSVYLFPESIHTLFTMEYKVDGEFANILMPESINAQIDMKGINNKDLSIDIVNVSVGTYDFIVSENMYYDIDNNNVVYGNSHNIFLDEAGLIIPWDYSNNSGQIKFRLDIKNYSPMSIKFDLSFKNIHPLRGNEGRYYFDQTKQ